ncbi:MAG: MBL fold metallo-hydrolase [Candidatus Diapherotrites archaeon]
MLEGEIIELIVLGSGGAVAFPRPCCSCSKCKEARKKGIPYARTGPSLFLKDESVLFDTPEEITLQLNREKIKEVKRVFYTHWHPDHTQGMRLYEHLNFNDFNEKGLLAHKKKPVQVYVPEDVVEDIRKYSPSFFYFQKKEWMKINPIKDRKPVKFGSIKITPLNLKRDDRTRYAYLIEEKDKKVVYAPCSIYKMKIDSSYKNLNLLFIETGWFGDTKKLRATRKGSFPDHISFEEDIELIKKLKPKKTILTHIEGCNHTTYDKVKKAIKPFIKENKIEVACDGMKLKI